MSTAEDCDTYDYSETDDDEFIDETEERPKKSFFFTIYSIFVLIRMSVRKLIDNVLIRCYTYFINGRNAIASDNLERFNRIRGKIISGLTEELKKEFDKHDICFGRVTNVNDDSANDDHRIFEYTYDDDDVEWIGVDEFGYILLLSEQESVCILYDDISMMASYTHHLANTSPGTEYLNNENIK